MIVPTLPLTLSLLPGDADRERGGGGGGVERDSIFRMRERRWLDNALRDDALPATAPATPAPGGKENAPAAGGDGKRTASALSFGDELQFWCSRVGGATGRRLTVAFLRDENKIGLFFAVHLVYLWSGVSLCVGVRLWIGVCLWAGVRSSAGVSWMCGFIGCGVSPMGGSMFVGGRSFVVSASVCGWGISL